MPQLVPVDVDPFSAASSQAALVPVDHDPFGPSPATPAGYVGTRALAGAMEAGREAPLGPFASPTDIAGITADRTDYLNGKSGRETANQWIYGQPSVAAPNQLASDLGDIAETATSQPAQTVLTPGYTAFGTEGGNIASRFNAANGSPISDWAARLIGAGAGGTAWGLSKGAVQSLWNAFFGEGSKATRQAAEIAARFAETEGGKFQGPAQAALEATGPQSTVVNDSRTLLQRVTDWLDTRKAQYQSDFGAIERPFVDSGTRVPGANAQAWAAANAEAPLSATEKEFLAKLEAGGGSLPYTAMKQWRTDLGADGSRIYDAVTNDMETALRAQGGDDAVQAFRNANTGYRADKSFIEARLGKLDDPTVPAERIKSFITNPGDHATEISDLLRAGVINPDDVRSMARTWLETNGRTAQGHLDPEAISKAMGNLQAKRPEAYNLLFGDNPGAQDLQQASNEVSLLNSPLVRANQPRPGMLRRAIPAVGTLLTGKFFDVPGLETLGGVMFGEGGHAAAGNPIYALPKPFPGSGLLTSPMAAGTYTGLLGPQERASIEQYIRQNPNLLATPASSQ
jgi:hypothetical protein